jgi:hypothetical protein
MPVDAPFLSGVFSAKALELSFRVFVGHCAS